MTERERSFLENEILLYDFWYAETEDEFYKKLKKQVEKKLRQKWNER